MLDPGGDNIASGFLAGISARFEVLEGPGRDALTGRPGRDDPVQPERAAGVAQAAPACQVPAAPGAQQTDRLYHAPGDLALAVLVLDLEGNTSFQCLLDGAGDVARRLGPGAPIRDADTPGELRGRIALLAAHGG